MSFREYINERGGNIRMDTPAALVDWLFRCVATV